MNSRLIRASIALAAMFTLKTQATVHYVDLNCTNPGSPYTSWATAATNIQDAVDAASFSDLILVTNGIYQTGSSVIFGANRVNVNKAVTIQSVNGPSVTIIQGYQVPGTTNGASAIRCAYLASGATLSGFTVTSGGTLVNNYGGGIYCQSASAIVTNCILTLNAAGSGGGGIYSGTLKNCTLFRNAATGDGGGSFGSTLINCLLATNSANNGGGATGGGSLTNCILVGNSARVTGGGAYYANYMNNCTMAGNSAGVGGGGGEYGATLNNCIIYDNTTTGGGTSGTNAFNSTLNFCCTTPLPGSGVGNITNPPLFANQAAGDFHLNAASPCINSGTNTFAPVGNDFDGNPRIVSATVDIGAYEFQLPIHYVSINNTAPVSPFTNWVTAATNIQDAIDAASAGDFIVVSNGTYKTGGRAVYGIATNRVTIDKAVTVQSVNGSAVTAIQGSQPVGNGAVRCAYLTNNAVLIGFTLTNGATHNSGDNIKERSGAGVWCESTSAMILNCTLVTNVANLFGGGAYSGTMSNCILVRNSASINEGGGAYASILNNCIVSSNASTAVVNCTVNNSTLSNNSGTDGGGASHCTLVNCKITGNKAGYGGGADFSVLTNCLVLGNSVGEAGGGAADGSILVSCTVVSNSAGHATEGGASGSCVLKNCIVYYNNNNTGNYPGTFASNCCVTPLPTGGRNNFTNAPLFVNVTNDFHLQTNSPCINSGNNSYVASATDFDGNPRIAGGTVDIGAYEFQSPGSIISYAYLQRYGLPTDGSADSADSDGDGFNSWQEWITGTIPTDASSLLQMSSVAPTNNPSGATITWQSVSGVNYFVQRGSDLSAQPVFTTIQSNIVGQASTTSFTDTTAINGGPFLYRVGVQ